jgi:hypothetical protein
VFCLIESIARDQATPAFMAEAIHCAAPCATVLSPVFTTDGSLAENRFGAQSPEANCLTQLYRIQALEEHGHERRSFTNSFLTECQSAFSGIQRGRTF